MTFRLIPSMQERERLLRCDIPTAGIAGNVKLPPARPDGFLHG